jgi:carbamoyl-phosphate synthase large subunit
MKNRILVSSSGNKVPLMLALRKATVDSELDLEIIAGDMNPASLSFNFADDFWVMPENVEANFLEISEGCKSRNINVIMPTRDQDLLFFAPYIKRLENENIKLMMPNSSAIERCHDKYLFQKYVKEKGFEAIPSFLHLEQVEGDSIVVKERFGSGSKDVYLSVSREKAKSLAKSVKNPLFQQMFNGNEISIDVWISRNGKIGLASPRFRQFVVDGESKVTTTFLNREIEEIAINVAKALGIVGICVIQGFVNADNSLSIIECNPRFGGATTASINSGFPLLELELRELLGRPFHTLITNLARKSIKQIRAEHDYSF